MKRIVLFLILALGWLGLSAQSLVYGKLDRTGFEKVSKGAFWSSRPWAKDIYEGKLVPGYKVEVLDQDHFVMFAIGENNPLDRNYLIFPEGEIIIEKDGIKYAAICGNKIKSIRPVSDYANMVADTVDQKLDDSVVKTIILRDTAFIEKEAMKVIKPEEEFSDEVKVSIPTTTEQKTQKWLKRNWWVWALGTAGLGTAGGFIFPKDGYRFYKWFPIPKVGGPKGVYPFPAEKPVGPGGADPFGSGGRR